MTIKVILFCSQHVASPPGCCHPVVVSANTLTSLKQMRKALKRQKTWSSQSLNVSLILTITVSIGCFDTPQARPRTHPAGLHLHVPFGPNHVVLVGGHRHTGPGAEAGVAGSQRPAAKRTVVKKRSTRWRSVCVCVTCHSLLLPSQLLLQVPAWRLAPRAAHRKQEVDTVRATSSI